MHVAVIGRGLIGAAAARHLSGAGCEVSLVGPDEPLDKAAHRGVFASHYDEGRITRALDPHGFWSRVSRASIARYAEIEAQSGIRFFTECGTLIGGPGESGFVEGLRKQRAEGGIEARSLKGDALARTFPYFEFEPGTECFHEPLGAGHISPRRLVAAQSAIAEAQGARLLRAEVRGITPRGSVVRVDCGDAVVDADAVLIAAGGFTQAICPVSLPLTVFARTVAFFEVGEEEHARLAGMPALVFEMADGNDPYLLPPILYPDGKHYLKLGGDPADRIVGGREDAIEWFRSGGSPEVVAFLEDHMRTRMPGLRAEAVHSSACVTTFTPANLPIISPISDEIFVAVAGCGRGAKCSDELGRIAAETVLGRGDPALSLDVLSG